MADPSKVALALSTVAVVPSIYGIVMPTLTDVRGQADDSGHLAKGEQYACVISGAIVLGIAGVARSPEAAAAGMLAVVAFAVAYHHSVRVAP